MKSGDFSSVLLDIDVTAYAEMLAVCSSSANKYVCFHMSVP